MELIDGVSLEGALPEHEMPLDSLLDVGIPPADALAYAHENGVVHRDLKLSNVIRDATGRVRILDFGIAALVAPPQGAEDQATTVADPTSPGGPRADQWLRMLASTEGIGFETDALLLLNPMPVCKVLW